MSSHSDRIKIDFILNMIENIALITKRHGTVANALDDIEGQNALFMCLLQIGEKITKIEASEFSDNLPIKEAASIRNFIVHDYGGVNLEIIKEVIEIDIPKLKRSLESIT